MTTNDTVREGVTVPHTYTKLQYGRYIWHFWYRGPLRMFVRTCLLTGTV